MVSPYDSRFIEQSQEKIMVRGRTIAEKYMSGNDRITPAQLIEWLMTLNTDGWTNVRVEAHTEPCDGDRLESEHLVIRGDRLETDKEYKERQENIISKWQSDYERFLQQQNYYENTDIGRAQIAEVKKQSKRRIRYPEGMQERTRMNGSFAKLFGEGLDQILVVYRNGGECPTITITIRIPGSGIMDSKFHYEDTVEGYATSAERFSAIDEETAQNLAANMRKQFGFHKEGEST